MNPEKIKKRKMEDLPSVAALAGADELFYGHRDVGDVGIVAVSLGAKGTLGEARNTPNPPER
jgi:hypothetical protein